MSATDKDPGAATTPSFIAALVTAGIIVGAFTAVWVVLHGSKRLRKVFQPRAELAPKSKRPVHLPDGIFSFWRTVLQTPDQEIIVANGPDAYLFVRYLKVFGVQMLVPYVILSIAVCLPVSTAKPNAGQTGLNQFAFGNVAPDRQVRHVAHFLVALILIAWTLFLIFREYKHFVDIRQAWLVSPQHLTLARTRTIAVANLPKDYNNEGAIKELAGTVGNLTGNNSSRQGGGYPPRPSNVTEGTVFGDANAAGQNQVDSEAGSVRRVWIPRKIKEVEDVWEERDQEVTRLEGGVGKLVKLANKNYRKGKTPEQSGNYDAERSTSMVDRFVLPKKQPTWKQGFLGLLGKKMTLESSPAYIREHNEQLETLRNKEDSYEKNTTAFVRFDSQADAHSFARLAPSVDKKLRMLDTAIEVVPEDVEWTNLAINPYQRKVRTIISWALTIGLIIIWAIPVAFVGVVSNVDTLCTTAPWLAWICQIGPVPLSILKGVLPPALLAVLFILLPIVLRMFVKLQGEIRKSDIEYKLFSRFWLFQVIHGFLIVTVASGLVNALGNLGNMTGQIPTLLAEKLPGASIFFLTFILTATFATAAKTFSRVIPVVMFYLKSLLGGNTPRKIYISEYKMQGFAWATTWPPVCLIVCITIVYSVIQPIITILAWLAFVLLYGAYKYTLYWVADQPDHLETGGLYYIKALRTVFVSLYLEEICLAGLFFLSTDQTGSRSTTGLACGAIMIVVIIATAVFQIYIDWFRFRTDYLVYAHSPSTVKSTKADRLANSVGVHTTKTSLGGPANNGVASTTPAQLSAEEEDENAGAEYGNTSGYHDRAFDHPAMWKKQPVVWITNDPLGVGKFETERIQAAGVDASYEYTGMDEKGGLQVTRAPPDQAWYYGITA